MQNRKQLVLAFDYKLLTTCDRSSDWYEALHVTQIEMVCWTTFLVTQETQSCLPSNFVSPCWCCNWNMLRESHSHWSSDASVSLVLGHLMLIRARQSDFTPAEIIFHTGRESWSWWDPGPSLLQPEENAILTLSCKSIVWNSWVYGTM